MTQKTGCSSIVCTFVSKQSWLDLLTPSDHTFLFNVRFPDGVDVLLSGQHFGDILGTATIVDTFYPAIDLLSFPTLFAVDRFQLQTLQELEVVHVLLHRLKFDSFAFPIKRKQCCGREYEPFGMSLYLKSRKRRRKKYVSEMIKHAFGVFVLRVLMFSMH